METVLYCNRRIKFKFEFNRKMINHCIYEETDFDQLIELFISIRIFIITYLLLYKLLIQ